MSLTIILKATDGLVLAADSRKTEGYSLKGPKTSDDSIKFIQLADDWGILTYGLLEIGYTGLSTLKRAVSSNIKLLFSAGRLLEKGHQIFSRKSLEWSQKNQHINRKDKDVGFVLAGFERDRGIFSVYNLHSPSFTPAKSANGCLLAGQWHVSKFFANRLYSENMAIVGLKRLAAFMLHATMIVEKTVGGPIHMATITDSKGFQWVGDDERKAIFKENKRLEDFIRHQIHTTTLNALSNRQIENFTEKSKSVR